VVAETVNLDGRRAHLAGIGFMIAGVTLFSWHDALNK
jgi:hypothetical protein